MRIVNALLLILVAALMSCENNPVSDCFNSTGPITQVEREIDTFRNINLFDNINLILRKAEKNKLILEAGSNLMTRIVTKVNDKGTLEIRNENSCNWVRSFNKPINVYLDFVKLDSLEYRSIGDVTSLDTIRMDSLHLDVKEGAGEIKLALKVGKLYCNLHYGTATIKLSGFAGLCFTYSASFGLIDNRNLETGFHYVTNKSSNNVFVSANIELSAVIVNIGNIYYTGDPKVFISQTGSGQLIRLDP